MIARTDVLSPPALPPSLLAETELALAEQRLLYLDKCLELRAVERRLELAHQHEIRSLVEFYERRGR